MKKSTKLGLLIGLVVIGGVIKIFFPFIYIMKNEILALIFGLGTAGIYISYQKTTKEAGT